jgi:hypothetical protein
MMKNFVALLCLTLHLATCFASERPALKPSDVYLGNSVCVAKGVSHTAIGHRFGLPANRHVVRDDALSLDDSYSFGINRHGLEVAVYRDVQHGGLIPDYKKRVRSWNRYLEN